MLVTTTPILGGVEIQRYISPLAANVVLGVNFFSDFAASIRDVFGGFSGTYQSKLDSITSEVDKLIKAKAIRLGANAIIDYKLQFNEISGKGKQMFMVTATGTACVVKMPEQEALEEVSQVSYSQIRRQYLIVLYKQTLKAGTKFSEKDWENILSFNLSEIAPELTAEYLRLLTVHYDDYAFTAYRDSFAEKFEEYLSRQDKSVAADALYPFLDSNPAIIVGLVVKYELFNPKVVLNQLKAGNLSIALDLLRCHKDYYTREDLAEMQEIVKTLDNLPDRGSMQMVKGGLFSKKEEEMYVCPNGHKNYKEEQYCLEPGCGLNIKGLSKNQVISATLFRRFTCALASILK